MIEHKYMSFTVKNYFKQSCKSACEWTIKNGYICTKLKAAMIKCFHYNTDISDKLGYDLTKKFNRLLDVIIIMVCWHIDIILTEVSILLSCNLLPHSGHLDCTLYSSLTVLDESKSKLVNCANWLKIYKDLEEESPSIMLESRAIMMLFPILLILLLLTILSLGDHNVAFLYLSIGHKWKGIARDSKH